jgi:hypothetical protein
VSFKPAEGRFTTALACKLDIHHPQQELLIPGLGIPISFYVKSTLWFYSMNKSE